MSLTSLSTAFGGFCLALCTLAAAEAGAETEGHPEVRKAILESYRFDPKPPATREEKPAPFVPRPFESDPDTVVLPTYEVRSRRLPRGLAEAIANSRPDGPQNHSRFGTGIHEKDFGKIRAGVITILYIPVCFGISW